MVNISRQGECAYNTNMIVVLSLVDIITLLMGQPVIIKLLMITFKFKKTTDILNFNLALFHNVQYLISILHLIFVLLKTKTHSKIAQFLLVYVEIGGPMGLCFICLERYVAVIHPTSYPLLKTYRCRELCALLVWLLSLPMASLNVLGKKSPFYLTEATSKFVPLGVMLAMATMMVYCSARIARALKKCGPGRDKLHPVKRRALRAVCATSIITICCYFPVTSIQSFAETIPDLDECILTSIYIFFLSAASIVHSVVYLSTQGELSAYLKALYSPCRALI